MKKPIPITNITIQGPPNMTLAQAQRMAAVMRQQSKQQQRDWKIYQQGVRDGSSGISIFGLKIF